MRRGFTLVEMLVACGIFLFGFMTVYTMFLVGVRNRTLADATTRGATVASSIIAEVRLRATNEIASAATTSIWAIPKNYVGDGYPDTSQANEYGNDPYNANAAFYAHPDQPGTYYRVIEATDLAGTTTNATDGVVLTLVIGQLDSNQPFLTLQQLQDRYRLGAGPFDLMIEELVRRGTLQRYDAVVHREVAFRR